MISEEGANRRARIDLDVLAGLIIESLGHIEPVGERLHGGPDRVDFERVLCPTPGFFFDVEIGLDSIAEFLT